MLLLYWPDSPLPTTAYDFSENAIRDEYNNLGNPTAKISFIAPTDDVFLIKVLGQWGAPPSGSYTLSVKEAAFTPVTVDAPASFEYDNVSERAFSFEGSAGDFVDVYLSAEDRIEGELRVYGPNFELLGVNSTGSVQQAPAVLGVHLPLDGLYSVILLPPYYNPGPIAAELTLTQVDGTILSAEPTELTTGEDFIYQAGYYPTELGKQYDVTVAVTEETAGSYSNININDGLHNPGQQGSSFVQFRSTDSITVRFTAESTMTRIEVGDRYVTYPYQFYVSITDVE